MFACQEIIVGLLAAFNMLMLEFALPLPNDAALKRQASSSRCLIRA
jgi:hypothetical protein